MIKGRSPEKVLSFKFCPNNPSPPPYLRIAFFSIDDWWLKFFFCFCLMTRKQGHLRFVGSSITTTSHTESSSNNRSCSKCQRPGQRGKERPGTCSRGQNHHSRFVALWILASSNNKCLFKNNLKQLLSSWLTLVFGRAAHAWLCLISGSWGSSSTKPLMLYLLLLLIIIPR